ncbi:hypothetical protein [Mycobacterium sp.]|uniref:hypothetical protein n=1 Tax=Mycobacterium sp. TaxID=1785 RepID=UPI00126B13E3|nr:hypothetical protein [Mycobacterium sp.]KAA8963892.1 MAG: hypothetical protein F6Q13_10585 [Mycobacterium sp.]
MDQGFFAGHRAAGQKEVTQCVWVYEHPVDFDGLRRFHHNLGYGLMGRRIERSPLPFGRHRWVVDRWPLDIDIAQTARPRAELSDWVDERSQLPVDAEHGPSWHLGVLPLTDGATAITLVASHYVVDGLGFVVAVADAILGNIRDFGYPPPGARTRPRAVLQDAGQTARDTPQVARALVAATKLAREQARGRRHGDRSPAPRPAAADGDDPVVVPGITIYVGLPDWDARAAALGGTSSTLVAGLAVKLAERMGRRRGSDGAVTLQLPISDRVEGDTRAVALSLARVSIDPTRVTTDLREARAAIKQALTTLRETPDTAAQLLWLAPWTPKPTFKRMVDAGFADPDLPVIVSNLGDLGSLVNRADGTPAEYLAGRGMRQGLTRGWLERIGGEMYLLSLRIAGKISITVRAYQPGAENTKPALRQLAARTLAEFGLTGEID